MALTNKEVVSKLRELAAGSIVPDNNYSTNKGLCALLWHVYDRADLATMLQNQVIHWELFSGNVSYPVPFRNSLEEAATYYIKGYYTSSCYKWKIGELDLTNPQDVYVNNRRKLCAWFADLIETTFPE